MVKNEPTCAGSWIFTFSPQLGRVVFHTEAKARQYIKNQLSVWIFDLVVFRVFINMYLIRLHRLMSRWAHSEVIVSVRNNSFNQYKVS